MTRFEASLNVDPMMPPTHLKSLMVKVPAADGERSGEAAEYGARGTSERALVGGATADPAEDGTCFVLLPEKPHVEPLRQRSGCRSSCWDVYGHHSQPHHLDCDLNSRRSRFGWTEFASAFVSCLCLNNCSMSIALAALNQVPTAAPMTTAPAATFRYACVVTEVSGTEVRSVDSRTFME